MINYSSKVIDEIFHYVINSEKIIPKPNQPSELTVSHLHSFIGWRGYLSGLGLMSAEARMAAGNKRDMRMGSGLCPSKQGRQQVKMDMRMGSGLCWRRKGQQRVNRDMRMGSGLCWPRRGQQQLPKGSNLRATRGRRSMQCSMNMTGCRVVKVHCIFDKGTS